MGVTMEGVTHHPKKNCSDHLKNGEELCIRVCFNFFFSFHAKSSTIENYWGSSDTSYQCPSVVIRTIFKSIENFVTVLVKAV